MLDEAYSTSVHESSQIKNIIWVGSSRTDLKTFPAEVMAVMGYALYQAQLGRKAPSAKPLHGFGGAGILEIVRDHHTDAYRAVYTVKFSEFVYVLHAFQKKSRKGIATPKPDIDLIRRRLRTAEEHYQTSQAAKEHTK
jgi:phage-related protein